LLDLGRFVEAKDVCFFSHVLFFEQRNPLGEEGERKIRQAAQFQKLCRVLY
jgi:hypothetical protein